MMTSYSEAGATALQAPKSCLTSHRNIRRLNTEHHDFIAISFTIRYFLEWN
jgi:hypothetical protein